MKRLILLLLLPAAGCGGKYVGHAYGTSTGKTYSAPDICQAVASCKAAGEKECLYSQSDTFSCENRIK